MDFGVATFLTDESPGPVEMARWVEDRGFESLFVPEHTHIPASRETPYPMGGELPREYARILDPFVALTAAGAEAPSLRLGTGLCLVIERDPIVMAKEVASLDLVSGGRVELGVGAGWNLEEMRNHGTDPERRFGVMRERVAAMRAIWTDDEASYDGKHVSFERITAWPKPVQKPHPPVLVGGNGRTVYDRVIAFGDAWIPNYLGDVEKLTGRIRTLQRKAGEAGRDPIPVTIYGVPRDPEAFAAWEEAGATRSLFYLPPASAAEHQASLDRCAAAVATYRA